MLQICIFHFISYILTDRHTNGHRQKAQHRLTTKQNMQRLNCRISAYFLPYIQIIICDDFPKSVIFIPDNDLIEWQQLPVFSIDQPIVNKNNSTKAFGIYYSRQLMYVGVCICLQLLSSFAVSICVGFLSVF